MNQIIAEVETLDLFASLSHLPVRYDGYIFRFTASEKQSRYQMSKFVYKVHRCFRQARELQGKSCAQRDCRLLCCLNNPHPGLHFDGDVVYIQTYGKSCQSRGIK